MSKVRGTEFVSSWLEGMNGFGYCGTGGHVGWWL